MNLLTNSSPEALSKIYQTWAEGLEDLPDAAIRFGLVRARDFIGFFTIGEFRELCRLDPKSIGLPETRQAYIEACTKPVPWADQQWSHPAVHLAAKETGGFTLHNMTDRDAFPLFKSNYEIMCSRVMNGEKLDMPIQTMLPETVPNPTPPDVAKAHLSRFKRML